MKCMAIKILGEGKQKCECPILVIIWSEVNTLFLVMMTSIGNNGNKKIVCILD